MTTQVKNGDKIEISEYDYQTYIADYAKSISMQSPQHDVCWELKSGILSEPFDSFNEGRVFKILDERLFFMAIIKYGVNFSLRNDLI